MKILGKYPSLRLRRNRKSSWARKLVEEHNISVNDLILPIFVTEGKNRIEEIKSMPGVYRYTVDKINNVVNKANKIGIPLIAIFPNTPKSKKNFYGSEALNENNLVCRTIRKIKKNNPNIGIMSDVALDPYTSHGHDGIMKKKHVLNDETIQILSKQAILQAQMGCDVIAPSDMMDGRIGVIRKSLDRNNYKDVQILSYSAKYASSFYGPFRNAIGSSQKKKINKKTYQMDYRNSDEAIREVALDIKEGADFVMIKPGLPYLDIIKSVKENFKIPVFVYQVSGEYSMIKNAIQKGILDEESAIESLVSFKRSGASAVITYFALEIANKLSN
jgi:porphobilinogen synthase